MWAQSRLLYLCGCVGTRYCDLYLDNCTEHTFVGNEDVGLRAGRNVAGYPFLLEVLLEMPAVSRCAQYACVTADDQKHRHSEVV